MTFSEYFYYFLLIVFAPHSLKTMEWRMLKLLNRDRRRNGGLLPVRMQDDLRDVARKHSLDMAKKEYFAHVNLKAQSPADRLNLSGVSDVTSGENLAKIGGHKNPTQFAEDGLMNSPGHRANILNPIYNAVGIGVVQSKYKIYYFTQNFAKRYLLFKGNIPKKISIKRGLHLRGNSFSNVHKILCHVKKPRIDNILIEHLFDVKNGRFYINFPFKERGKYEVFIYVDVGQKNTYKLANRFEIRVKKGWFF